MAILQGQGTGEDISKARTGGQCRQGKPNSAGVMGASPFPEAGRGNRAASRGDPEGVRHGQEQEGKDPGVRSSDVESSQRGSGEQREAEDRRVLQSFGIYGLGPGPGLGSGSQSTELDPTQGCGEHRIRARVQGVRGRGPHRPPHVPGSGLLLISPQMSLVPSRPRERACNAHAHRPATLTALGSVRGPRPQNVQASASPQRPLEVARGIAS